MKIETIERYLDECGITPGRWVAEPCFAEIEIGEKCWCGVVNSTSKDKEGDNEWVISAGACRKVDTQLIAASREMLKALIGWLIDYQEYWSVDDDDIGTELNPILETVGIIEAALPGRTWPEIKARLEEIEEEEE